MYLSQVEGLQIGSILLAWDLNKRKVKQCGTGCPTCNGASLSRVLSPCVNESKMDAWEEITIRMAASNMLFFTYQFSEE